MLEEIKLIDNPMTAKELLLDFSKKVSELSNNNIILFNNNFLKSLYSLSFADTSCVTDSTYVGIYQGESIRSKIYFQERFKLTFERKELSPYICVLTTLKLTSKDVACGYHAPDCIDNIHNVYKLPDTIK